MTNDNNATANKRSRRRVTRAGEKEKARVKRVQLKKETAAKAAREECLEVLHNSPLAQTILQETVLDAEIIEKDRNLPLQRFPYELKYVARLLFISGAATIPSIAKELKVSENTIRSWHAGENWSKLRKLVFHQANKDAVRQARLAMGRYAKAIDASINKIVDNLDAKLASGTLEPIKSEASVLKLKMDTIQAKIALLRTLTYGSYRRSLSPHPETTILDTTAAPTSTMLAKTQIEELLNSIPEYMRAAAKFVLAMDPREDIPSDVIEAVSFIIDSQEQGKQKEASLQLFNEESSDNSTDNTLMEIIDDGEEF
jgi:hypothetical protein